VEYPGRDGFTEEFSEDLRQRQLASLAKDASAPFATRAYAHVTLSLKPGRQGHGGLCAKTSLLFTYQGDWGLLPGVKVQPWETIPTLSARLSVHPAVQALDQEAFAWLTRVRSEHLLQHFAFALELCTDTFAKQGVLRVHMHLWVKPLVPNLTVGDLVFKGTTPFLNTAAASFFAGTGTRCQAAAYAGCLYVTARKLGSLVSRCTIEPFTGFPVRDLWVTGLYQAGKIDAEEAERLYTRCVNRAEQNIRQLRYVEQHLREAQDSKRLKQEFAHLRATLRPFKRIAVVEEWLAQYLEPRLRYKFLVLVGPSQMGKTRFAASLGESPAEFFLSDCSQGFVDLRPSFFRARASLGETPLTLLLSTAAGFPQ